MKNLNEIIRCKDCKWYLQSECEDGTTFHACRRYACWSGWDDETIGIDCDDFFCANGEAKEEEHNVEIVMCKDCEHWEEGLCGKLAYDYDCTGNLSRSPFYFCADGERRSK